MRHALLIIKFALLFWRLRFYHLKMTLFVCFYTITQNWILETKKRPMKNSACILLTLGKAFSFFFAQVWCCPFKKVVRPSTHWYCFSSPSRGRRRRWLHSSPGENGFEPPTCWPTRLETTTPPGGGFPAERFEIVLLSWKLI